MGFWFCELSLRANGEIPDPLMRWTSWNQGPERFANVNCWSIASIITFPSAVREVVLLESARGVLVLPGCRGVLGGSVSQVIERILLRDDRTDDMETRTDIQG